MKIKIDDVSYFATVDTLFLAMQGECMTRCVFVEHPTVKGTTDYFLRVEMPDMTIYDLQIVNHQVVLTNTITAYAATIPLQWIAKDNTGAIIAKSQIINAVIKDSIDGDVAALPTPEEMKTYYNTYINTITQKGDQYLSEMETIQQSVTQTSKTVKADADRTESNVNRAESLLQSLQSYTIGERARIYVNTASGSDDNDGRTTTTAVKTLDKALVLANSYKNAIICLKRGQTYTATDQTNEYGSGIHLYARSIRLEAIQNNDSILTAPKIQNTIFAYHGSLEIDDIDFVSSNSNIILYNSFCNLNKSTMQNIKSHNSVVTLSDCTTPYLLQYGGCTAIHGGEIDSIQVENGGFLNFANCQVGGYISTPPSIICKNGIPVYMEQANRIAKESVEVITRYVNSTSGSDSNDGSTAAKAFSTLEKALKAVGYAKKAVIRLAAGTYIIPNKEIAFTSTYLAIAGVSSSDTGGTIVKGNISLDNSYLKLLDMILDCTDEEYADTSATAPIRALSNSKVHLSRVAIYTATKYCISATEISNVYCYQVSFSGCTSYAIMLTGGTSATIYKSADISTKGLYSDYGCRAYLANNSYFTYKSANYGLVYVDGKQAAPQTAETAAVLSMGGNV